MPPAASDVTSCEVLTRAGVLREASASLSLEAVARNAHGDGKADALVRVMTGGAAGAVAAYALSTDGTKSSNLRVVMRNQRLYRATLRVNSARNLVVRVPVYAAGDTMCCPSRARDRTYAWDAKAKQMRRISMVEFPLM